VDEGLRELERRVQRDPSDEGARLSLALALFRAGKDTEARAAVRADSREGYSALARAVLDDPQVGPLLDQAPEWRSSGGDEGCTRWSKARPVLRPRTAWRRRIEGVHAALALSIDRGRAFVLAQVPGRKMELVCLSPLTGETLWRFPLGQGPAGAPASRGGSVHVTSRDWELGGISTFALRESNGEIEWKWAWPAPPGEPCFPGAANVAGDSLLQPLVASSRGSSKVRESLDARLQCLDLRGNPRWSHTFWNTGLEVAATPRSAFILDRGAGGDRLLRVRLDGSLDRESLADGGDRIACSGRYLVAAGHGLVVCHEDAPAATGWSTQGALETSLAFDGERVLIGRANSFTVRDKESGREISTWQTAEGPLPYAPKGTAQAPPCLRSAVCAGDLAYVASPLAPSISAYDVTRGSRVWTHTIPDLLVPEEGPRLTWPIAEIAPPDRGPLHLAPLPGMIFGITLSGYAFLIEDEA